MKKIEEPSYIECGGMLQARFGSAYGEQVRVNIWTAHGFASGQRFYVGAPQVYGNPYTKIEGSRRRAYQRRALYGFFGGTPGEFGYEVREDQDGDLVADRRFKTDRGRVADGP